jgi:Ca-activated chloride channel family protein
MRLTALSIAVLIAISGTFAQSGRSTGYSESRPSRIIGRELPQSPATAASVSDTDVERVATDLVTIPVRVSTRDGKPVTRLGRTEFRIFENGVQQQLAYFSDDEQPFTVALVLDMSYSSVFKLEDIQLAARIFVSKLRDNDHVMVVSFDEKTHVLCAPTSDRKVLRLAIDGSKIGSGTALYDTLDMVGREKLAAIPGRRAIVLLSDGVDTSSVLAKAKTLEEYFAEEDVIVYPIQYDTYDDVQRSRKKDAQILFDENDRPYVVQTPAKKGEREQDYEAGTSFLSRLAEQTAGRVYRVSSTTNLNDAFSNIADELRRIYSLGYYPAEDRKSGAVYDIKVRVYRPNLKVTARSQYFGK